MKIDSMDATNRQDYYVDTVQKKEIPQMITPQERKSSQAEPETGVHVSEKAVINAIEKANKAIVHANRELEFSVHEKTKEIMVKVLDSVTKEVIRDTTKKILDMVANMLEMAGILVDERR